MIIPPPSKRILFLVILTVFFIKALLFFWGGFIFDFTAYPEMGRLDIWDRWDGTAYKAIATSFYEQTAGQDAGQQAFLVHFPPFYPLVMRAASMTGFGLPLAGLLVSLVSIIAASVFLFKLVWWEFQSWSAAFWSVLFLTLFPTSYFTISVYAESLFLLLTIAGFYYLRKERFFLSGLLVAAAILTRLVGVVLLPILVFYILFDVWRNRRINWRLIWLILLPGLALAAYLGINKFYFGDYLYFLHETLSFNNTKHWIFPFHESWNDLKAAMQRVNFSNPDFMMTRGWNAVFTWLSLGLTLLGIKRVKWEYTVYSLGSVFLFASLSWGISNARYVFSVFPMFMILGSLKNRFLQGGILVVFLAGLLYFTKIFMGGGWAF